MGTHLVYAARGECRIRLDGENFTVPSQGTLKVELTEPAMLALVSGLAVLGSIWLLA